MYKLSFAVATLVVFLSNGCLSTTEMNVSFCPFVDTNTTGRIECDRLFFQTISVTSATYRRTCGPCPSSHGDCQNCTTVDETELVRNKCQDRRVCNVSPRKADVLSGSPSCTGNVSTFLDVSYTCKNLAGYMGCFELEENNKEFTYTDLTVRTILRCLDICRGQLSPFAGLWNGNICVCRSNLTALQPVPTQQCNVNCRDSSQHCGGLNNVDMYNTSVGQCNSSLNNAIRIRDDGVIYSPGFPGKYPINVQCSWIVTAPWNKVIKVTFYLLNLQDDFLHLRDGNSSTASLLTNEPLRRRTVLTSSSNHIWISFRSNGTSSGRFILNHTAIGHCGKIKLIDRGEVSPDRSGNFGIGVTVNITCKGDSSTVVKCLETGNFNAALPKCVVRPTDTPSEQPPSSQPPTPSVPGNKTGVSMATERNGSNRITVAPGNGSSIDIIPPVPASPSATEDSTLPISVGAAVGGVVLLAAAIATVAIVMKRRSSTPAPSSKPAPDDVTADPSPEPTYDTIREEEEGGVTLALSGATCSYSTIGQNNVTSDSDRQEPVCSKPDKSKAKTARNVEDLYAKPDKKVSGEVENVLYESAGEISGASPGHGALMM